MVPPGPEPTFHVAVAISIKPGLWYTSFPCQGRYCERLNCSHSSATPRHRFSLFESFYSLGMIIGHAELIESKATKHALRTSLIPIVKTGYRTSILSIYHYSIPSLSRATTTSFETLYSDSFSIRNMYIISTKDLESAARQAHLPLEDMTRIRESRKWWMLPFTKRRDLPPPFQDLLSVFEAIVVRWDISQDVTALIRCLG